MIRIVYLLTHIQHTAYKYIVINQGPKDELRLIENLRNGYKNFHIKSYNYQQNCLKIWKLKMKIVLVYGVS